MDQSYYSVDFTPVTEMMSGVSSSVGDFASSASQILLVIFALVFPFFVARFGFWLIRRYLSVGAFDDDDDDYRPQPVYSLDEKTGEYYG